MCMGFYYGIGVNMQQYPPCHPSHCFLPSSFCAFPFLWDSIMPLPISSLPFLLSECQSNIHFGQVPFHWLPAQVEWIWCDLHTNTIKCLPSFKTNDKPLWNHFCVSKTWKKKCCLRWMSKEVKVFHQSEEWILKDARSSLKAIMNGT